MLCCSSKSGGKTTLYNSIIIHLTQKESASTKLLVKWLTCYPRFPLNIFFPQVFHTDEFLSLSESMVQMMMARNLEVVEITKFEAMLTWARFRVRARVTNRSDSRAEFRAIMERLTRELKLYRISPQDLIKVCCYPLLKFWHFVPTINVYRLSKDIIWCYYALF